MKKIISLLLAFSIVFSACVTYTSAQVFVEQTEKTDFTEVPDVQDNIGKYPESEHDYQNNAEHYSAYIHPEEADGLFVTFSPETYFEPSFYNEETDEYKEGDYLEIYYGENEIWLGLYSEDELASKTIYIPGSSFMLCLYSDSSVTGYGYKIERIDTSIPEGVSAICYNFDEERFGFSKYYHCYTDETEAFVTEGLTYKMDSPFYNGCQYRYGWSTEPDGALEYEDYETIPVPETVLNLYEVFADLSINSSEVYRFQNSGDYFDVVEDNESVNYYMTLENYITMLTNVLKSGGMGPMPIFILAAILSTLPNWNWNGSCYGMSSSVFLQHHGVIDMLSLQEGAETMHDLRPTSSVISAINFYQAQSATSYLCENLAPEAGTEIYKAQIRKMYESVIEGNPVLISYYRNKYLIESGHAVVITGAYTNKKGEHILLVYDPNDYSYAKKYISSFVISPDFSSISQGGTEVTFNWTDDYTQFEAFKINGETKPLLWYETFFNQIFEWISMFIA